MRRRGFTLIEVLIALVIFVVGALAVIRIFPPAFHVVQNSGYKNIATRLSDSIISQMKGDGSTPDAVFDITDNWSADPNQPVETYFNNPYVDNSHNFERVMAVVGTSTLNYSLPGGPDETSYDDSALSSFLFIRGEKHDIENTFGSDTGDNSPYILTNFPFTANSAGGVRLYADIKIDGVQMDDGGKLDFSNATYTNPFTGQSRQAFHEAGADTARPLSLISNAGDDNTAVFTFRSPAGIGGTAVDTGARFYVSYRYVDGDTGKINAVLNEPLNIPSDDNWDVSGNAQDAARVLQGMLWLKLGSNKPTLLAGSVQVTARPALFFVLNGNPMATPLDAWNNHIALGESQVEGNVGLVKLPPVVNDTGTDYISKMPQAKISADYLVPDWRILFNQSKTTSDGKVFLPMLLLPNGFDPQGVAVDSTSDYAPIIPTVSSVDVQERLVQYNSAYPTVRTAYKGLDQWAQQISPTAASYIPSINSYAGYIGDYRSPTTSMEHYYLPRESWREYFYNHLTPDTIFFNANEAGKTVEVIYIPDGSTTPVHKIFTIDKTLFYTTSGVTALAKLELGEDTYSILGIRGASIVARTAWLNGRKYEQSVVTGYRTANAD